MSRQGLLLITLVIIAGAGYIFCFTDLIKPGQGSGSPASHDFLVKKPMPPRPKMIVAVNEEKPAVEQQEVAVTPEHKTGVEQSAPVKASGEKKASPPQQAPTKQSTVKSEFGKPPKKPAAQKTPTKSAITAITSGKSESAKEVEKPSKKQDKIDQEEPASKAISNPSKGTYTLLVGVYVMEKSMVAEKTKLKSAGLDPVVTKGPKKAEPMNRLLMGEYDSYPEASIEMKKIKKITGNAFILPEKGKYSLYAGSYFVKVSAEKERDRLIKAGLKPVVRKTNVPVCTYRLTAGHYQTIESAELEAVRLKKLGVKASVIKSGT